MSISFFVKFFFFVVICAAAGYYGYDAYSNYFLASDYSKPTYVFEVAQGDTIRVVSDKMAKDQVLKTGNSLIFQNQLDPVENLQTGAYQITMPATPKDVLSQIAVQSKKISKEKQLLAKRKSITVVFKEGETVDDYIAKLVEAGLGTKVELSEYFTKGSNFNRLTYPWLPEELSCQYGQISNCIKYYIEGYLYPDTYSFFADATIPEISDKILRNFDNRVWQKVKSTTTNLNLNKAVIMASVIEKETGRPITGVDNSNIDEVNMERKNVASTFYNRLKKDQPWESDPSVVYGSGKRVCQSTLTVEGCVYLNGPEGKNKYNTYDNAGYPIGPITSPQWYNIQAALEPAKTNFLFFVSDGIGRKYFAETNSGHEANIAKAQKINSERVQK